jgi:hypothetical protein
MLCRTSMPTPSRGHGTLRAGWCATVPLCQWERVAQLAGLAEDSAARVQLSNRMHDQPQHHGYQRRGD